MMENVGYNYIYPQSMIGSIRLLKVTECFCQGCHGQNQGVIPPQILILQHIITQHTIKLPSYTLPYHCNCTSIIAYSQSSISAQPHRCLATRNPTVQLTSTFLNILQGNNTTLHILTLLPTSMTKSFAIHYTTFTTLHIALPLQPLPHCNTTSRYHGIAFNIQPSTPQHLTPIPLCPHPIQ